MAVASLIETLRQTFQFRQVSVSALNAAAVGAPKTPRKPDTTWEAEEEEDGGITVTDQYKSVRAVLEEGFPLVLVTGAAGTGKTTLVHWLRQSLNLNTAVVAPTGVAALNIGGVTINSLFRLPPRLIVPGDVVQLADRKLFRSLDLLVIDEISMVRVDLIDAIDQFMRLNGRHPAKPFGGIRVLMTGDLFQMPPVVPDAEHVALTQAGYDSPYFFSAKALQGLDMMHVELDQVYRQRDPVFATLLGKIRVAEDVATISSVINQYCFPGQAQPDSITLTCTNSMADGFNAARLAQLPGPVRLFTGSIEGTFRIDETRLPSPMQMQLKEGAQVMLTRNDQHKRWVNGTLARILSFDTGSIHVELLTDHPGEVRDIEPVTWEAYRYVLDKETGRIVPQVIGSYTQFPLTLAWAVTIHKSQGKTLERVRLDLGRGAFASGQAYVALSRCRSLTDIHLVRPIEPRDIICDERIRRFYASICSGN